MDVVFLQPSLISLVAIAIMIGTLVVAYLKKISLDLFNHYREFLCLPDQPVLSNSDHQLN